LPAKQREAQQARIVAINETSAARHIVRTQTRIGLDGARHRVSEIVDAARRENPEVKILCHGGPISTLEDASRIFKRFPAIDGFRSAKLMEGLEAETAITGRVGEFSN
jgi:predicted TIM-barrel enzyme